MQPCMIFSVSILFWYRFPMNWMLPSALLRACTAEGRDCLQTCLNCTACILSALPHHESQQQFGLVAAGTP